MADINKISLKNSTLFETLCNKIACLVYSRTDGDRKLLNQILDSLNELDYNLFKVKNDKGILVINQCCYLIPPNEISTSSKAINLFTNLITKAQISVQGKTLSLAVNWCVECLKQSNQVNVLKCLQALVKGKGLKIEEDFHHIFSEIQRLSNNFSFVSGDEDVCLNCLRCIEAISFPGDNEHEKFSSECVSKCFEIFQEILFKDYNDILKNEISFCKFLITAMRGIENVISTSEKIITTELSSLLGIVKAYMLYGLPGHNNYKIQKILPSSKTIPEVLKSNQGIRKLRGKYDRRSKKVAMSSIVTVEDGDDNTSNEYLGFSEQNQKNDFLVVPNFTSDSDFSDSEFSQNTKVKAYEGKVRHCALILLGKIVQKTDPKLFIAYMPSFLPDGSSFSHVRTLTTCLLNDPSPKCRLEVLGVLITIISNSRQYFLQADGISKSSFIAFSCTINNIIIELHKSLVKTLTTESNSTAIKRTLKCVSDLIRCSPYHKMKPGLISNISNCAKNFLNHRDVNVQIFALTVFGCLVSVDPKVQEVREVIIYSGQQKKRDNEISISKFEEKVDVFSDDYESLEEEEIEVMLEKPWLFEQCLKNLTDKMPTCDVTTNAALQIESLQVLGALVRNFFRETLISFPNDIIDLLHCCSNKSEYSIRLYSGKLMETVFNSLQFSFCQEDEVKRPSLAIVTTLWESLLPGPVNALIMSQEEPMLRSTGCDCIANVGVQIQNGQTDSVQNSLIFDQLSREKQILCITLLFGCMKDESPAVRSSAARALAIFVLFPSLREDSLFFLDAIDVATVAANDDHNIVRSQTSWLLGNLSEAIVLNKKGNIDDGVTLEVMIRMLQTSIKLANDSPKIKPGAIRAMGNLMQIVDENFMKKHKETVVEGIETLIKNATSGTFMKARWNSCYAIANLLQNRLIHSNSEWMSKVFGVMTSLVQHYKNFKVRISASFALTAPPTRESYGDLFIEVWSSLLNAMENSKNISDFKEYQHRDQLVDQLCLALCHLISLMLPSDLNPLQDVLYFHLDNLTNFLMKFQERIVPEKSNVLLSATDKLNLLMDEKNLTTEEKSVVRVLQNIFLNGK